MKKSIKLTAAAFLSAATLSIVSVKAQAEELGQGLRDWANRSQEEVNQSVAKVLADGSLSYIVQPGDTLSTIAEAFGMSVEQLSHINQIEDVDLIYVGSELVFNQSTGAVSVVNEGETTELVAPVHNEPVTTEAPVAAEPAIETVAPVTEWVESDTQVVAAQSVAETTPAAEPESVAEVAEVPVATPQAVEAPVAVQETPAQPEIVQPEYQAEPVQEATPAPVAPVVEEAPAVAPTTQRSDYLAELASYQENAGLSDAELAAKYAIRERESTHNYDVYSASGNHYGAYQMLDSYFSQYGYGDRSKASQEAASNGYVKARYGSWQAALQAHNAQGWY